MNRRDFLRRTSLVTSGALLGSMSWAAQSEFPVVRTPEEKRKFKSRAVERTIETIKGRIRNREVAWMFENCFPNALDTTVDFAVREGRPDTFVAQAGAEAMGLRDSTLQVWPYLPLMKNDSNLQQLVAGVIYRHTRCILLDPYANAFTRDGAKESPWKSDHTEMKTGIYERKWELDSLCYPIRLAYHYWKLSGDRAPFDAQWCEAMLQVVGTLRVQQRKDSSGPYRFQRTAEESGETLAGDGYGPPARPVGMVFSMFRPSGDATLFPLLVPANYLAFVSLRQAAEMLTRIHSDSEAAGQCRALAGEIERALREHAVVIHRKYGRILAYEINGYGDTYCMENAATPSLLSLPYLDAIGPGDPLYLNTRKFILSDSNPYYCSGKAASGPGGPRLGRDMISPLALIMQALTTNDDETVRECLQELLKTHGGTGFMREAFHKDDPDKIVRPSFPPANSLFGELVLRTYKERPHVLN